MTIRERLSRGIEPEIAALRRLRAARRLGEIVFFVLLWAAAIGLGLAAFDLQGAAAWAGRILSVAMAAAALNAFYLLSHEGHHQLLFRRPALNHLANVLLCVPLLHAPTAYRVLHTLHHRHLGGPGDPDHFHNYTTSARLRWALHWVRLTMGMLVYMPLIPVIAFRRATVSERRAIVLEYAAMTAVWIAVFASLPIGTLFAVWLGPGIVVGYVSAVRAVAQHALTDADDPLLASRSVTSNRLVAFLLLNENFHLEHHLFPEIPSYHLPRLRTLLQGRLPHTVDAPSYSRFMAGFVGRFLRGDESIFGYRRHATGTEPSAP